MITWIMTEVDEMERKRTDSSTLCRKNKRNLLLKGGSITEGILA